MNSPMLSIVIPVYNNHKTINDLYHKIMVEMSSANLSFEVVFVNDGSYDSSEIEINKLQSKHENIILLNNQQNIGQQKSILKGLIHSKGQYCVVMDADLQDSPTQIISLYENLKPPFEAVFIKRIGSYQSKQRMLTSFIFKSIASIISGLSGNAGTFFIIKADLIDKLVKLNCKYTYITYMIACLNRSKIGYINVIRETNRTNKSQYSSIKRIKAGINGLLCIFECNFKIKLRGGF